MWIVAISLLTLIIGIQAGFYARVLYNKVSIIADQYQDRKEAKEVGVVRVQGIPATKNQPIDLSSDTGPVRRPRPGEIEEQRQEQRAEVLRESHR